MTYDVKLYDLYVEAKMYYQEDESKDNLKFMQEIMLLALETLGQLPEEMQWDLVLSFRMLLNNEKDPYLFINHARKPVSTLAKSCRKDAVRYIRYAKENPGYDKHSVKTVAEAYGVKERTIMRWVNELGDDSLRILPVYNNPDGIRKIMKEMATLYKESSNKRGSSLHKKYM